MSVRLTAEPFSINESGNSEHAEAKISRDLCICVYICICVTHGCCFGLYTYLCLSGFALMARDADLIEEAVQLANDGVDLL